MTCCTCIYPFIISPIQIDRFVISNYPMGFPHMGEPRKTSEVNMSYICPWCGDVSNVTIMSKFCTDIICIHCKDIEKQHPRYKEACDIERQACLNGDYNFEGIGKPNDIQSMCRDAKNKREQALVDNECSSKNKEVG